MFPGKEKVIYKTKTPSSETSIKGRETETRACCESLIYLIQKGSPYNQETEAVINPFYMKEKINLKIYI